MIAPEDLSLKAPISEEGERQLGYYGCADRLVRVGRIKTPGKRPRHFLVPCPACGKEHLAEPLWRAWKDGDAEPEVEL